MTKVSGFGFQDEKTYMAVEDLPAVSATQSGQAGLDVYQKLCRLMIADGMLPKTTPNTVQTLNCVRPVGPSLKPET